jgi:integrase/recombinase XerD
MKKYKNYLESKAYSNKSIPTYLRSAERFNAWCKSFGTSSKTIDYKTFLKYIEHIKNAQIQAATVKNYVTNLKVYFNYLVSTSTRIDNPIINLHIKGVKKSIVRNLLESEELEDLYYSYDVEIINTLARKRNKIILGLLVYQGITTSELQRLKVEDVQLYKGKIDVLGTKKTGSRELELKPWQLMELMQYINEIRPELLEQSKKESDLLFFNKGKSNRLSNIIYALTKELKTINNSFINMQQIRNSVIVNWLSSNNLRKTQYMAGHKYISSTEKYQQDDLESLHETVNMFHPFS